MTDMPPRHLQTTTSTLDTTAEATLFRQLRWRCRMRKLQQSFRAARLRSISIVVLTVVFWSSMYWMFQNGFQLLSSVISHESTRAQTVSAVFNVFFLAILIMMIMSSGILLFDSLFRGREAVFLLTTPATPQQIVMHHFYDVALFSGWGFFLLGSPLLLAYGRTTHSPWYFYLLMLPFMGAFVMIPISLGGLLCLCGVYRFPNWNRRTWLTLTVLSVLLIGGSGLWMLTGLQSARGPSMAWFQSTIGRLKYSQQPWMPSWWLSSGILEAAHTATSDSRRSWAESLGFFACLLSTAMILYFGVAAAASRFYVAGINRRAAANRHRTVGRQGLISHCVRLMTAPLPSSMRILLRKDIAVFRRDVTQWSQLAIFFGLLTFYFVNLHRMQYGSEYRMWMFMVGYLNVAVVGLLLATFTTRFVYPLISLEGRKMWILGTLPVKRSDIVGSKFLFACGVSVLPCSLLILLSDVMLRSGSESPLVPWMHQLTCWGMCSGLSGIAVGLGATFPNFDEPSPAKISAGFGGTMALVLSVMFIAATVCGNAIGTGLWIAESHGQWPDRDFPQLSECLRPGSLEFVFTGAMLSTIGCLIATWWPLRSGLRVFRGRHDSSRPN